MAGSNFVTYVEIPWVKDHFIVCEFRSLERKQTKFLFGSIVAFTHFVKSEFVFPTFVNFTNLNIFPSRPGRDRLILFLDFTILNLFLPDRAETDGETQAEGSLVHCRRSWLEQWERGQWQVISFECWQSSWSHAHEPDGSYYHEQWNNGNEVGDKWFDGNDHELNGWKACLILHIIKGTCFSDKIIAMTWWKSWSWINGPKSCAL